MKSKTRNTISGVLVGLASLFAVSVFLEIPQNQINSFLLSTVLFFFFILILASLTILLFKLLGRAGKKISEKVHDKQHDQDNKDSE